MPDASVLIPSYNSKSTLVPCLERFARQTFPADRFELVVVLDGSTDGSAAALAELDVPYRLTVIEQANIGRGGALNHGARKASGDVLIITDSDIEVNDEFVAAHVNAHAEATGEVVVIGPIPLSPASPISFLTDGVAEWAEEHARNMTRSTDGITCDSIFGANISISRVRFLELGGYREDIRRTEDWELGKKVLDAGLRVVFCQDAIAWQIYDKTVHACCHDFYVDGESQAKLIDQYPQLRTSLKLGQYHPATLTKRILRPLVVHRRLAGEVILHVGQAFLEWARRRGMRARVLSSCQGVLADALYFRGVRDAAGSEEAYQALIAPPAGATADG